jgi:hypothetical protein
MAILKFSDGETFDTSGPLRKEERRDGWYVIGRGNLIPVKTQNEADTVINDLLRRVMTLTEYLDQPDPEARPTVEVVAEEFKILQVQQRAGRPDISIIVFNTKHYLLAGIQYGLIGERFYTLDPDGNPQRPSVFKLK